MKGIHIALFLGISLFYACAPNKQAESLCAQADSLMQVQPDSALRLLKTGFALQELSQKESARYALLLAQATDKCEKPLLPCDSLLDIALDYYDDDEKERAVALLYKGRLEAQMAQSERAVNFFLEGLEIIKMFPKEIKTRKHLLSSLGNEYYNARLYEKAREICQELYKCCITNKDKSIALNNLASYYSMTEKEDSALVFQYKALKYAEASEDSAMIAMSANNISVTYAIKEENDTALYYARMSLQWVPQCKNKSSYYANIGNIFIDKGEIDSATYYINKSIESDTNIKRKADALLNLSYIEEEKKDYQAVSTLLYQFVDIIDSLYLTEQSTKIQELVHKYDIQIKVHEKQEKDEDILRYVITGFTVVCIFITFFLQHRINKRKKLQFIKEQQLKQAQQRIVNLQNFIEENEHIIELLQKEQTFLKQEKEKIQQEVKERETSIEKLKKEEEKLKNWLFKQSDIYKKIIKLSEQKVSNKKELKVLTNAEKEKLTEIVFDIYADYKSCLKSQYPKLTDEDLLYLCLEKIGFSSQAISFCFGHFNTHALAQRKYRIKEKM